MTPQPPEQDAFTSTAALREAGRKPSLPARLRLSDGRELELVRALRVLPGKRITAEAKLNGAPILAKLFIADSASRHATRERDGLAALEAAGLPTPAHVADGTLAGGELVATAFLAHAESLAERWNAAPRPPGDPAAIALLTPALTLVARMHAAGLAQSDQHLGNFLWHNGTLHVIDGDAVERHPAPLAPAAATANLAILLAQVPPGWDAHWATLVAAYVAAGGTPPDPAALRTHVEAVRAYRLTDLLGKSVRDCTLFAVDHRFARFTSVVRDEAEALAPLLADPDAAIRNGTLLKDGNSATVVRADLAGHTLVIKRYNLKNARHALSRIWRPSRAWHAWRAAHHLVFLGIATPRPLALIEERFGPLRRRAWLINAYSPGLTLKKVLNADEAPPAAVGEALVATFTILCQAGVTHGDLKGSNLLWQDGALLLIDLDATTAHSSAAAFRRAWARDRARLLRNWPEGSVLAQWLDAALPPVPA